MPLRDLLILGVIFGALPFILYRPWFGILMWYWIGLMSPHRLGWGIAFNFPVAQITAIAVLVALVMAKDRKPIPVTRETVLLALFAVHITVTTYFAWAPTAWDQWDRVIKILFFTALTPMLIFSRHRITWLVIVIIVSLGFYGFKGGLFSVLTGGAHHVLGPRRSFISGNTNLGLALVMVLPLLLVVARALREQRLGITELDRWGVPLGYATYAVFWFSIVATVFTYSRGAWLGLLVVVPLIFLKMRRKLVLGLAGFLMAGTVVALIPDQVFSRFQTIQNYEEDGSAMTRLQAWGVNWNMAMDRPLIGVGFNNAGIGDERWLSYANWVDHYAMTARAPHSSYFQIIGHHGFLGAAIYFSMILFTMMTLLRIFRYSDRHPSTLWMRDFAWALLVGFVGFLITGAFLDMAYFTLVYVFIALAVIMRRELDDAESRVPDSDTALQKGKDADDRAPDHRPTFPDFVVSRKPNWRKD